ncbi:transposable element Tc1 transposase [Trichonephila clavipes]|nr:transposable element Tc1 transposase [Trichonephila clavipes]
MKWKGYHIVTFIAQNLATKKFGDQKVGPPRIQPKMFTEEDEQYLARKVKANPFLSTPKLAIIAENELGNKASPSTIRNVLHKKYLTGRKARQNSFISKRNQKIRHEFAKEHENKDFSYWKQVLFIDESKFNIFGSDSKPYV